MKPATPHALTSYKPLKPGKLRLHAVADPWVYVAWILGVIVAGVVGEPLLLLAPLGVASGLVAAAPWIPAFHRRALHREQRRNLRLVKLRSRNTERRLLRELPPPLAERYLDLKVRVQDVPRALQRSERDQVLDQVQGQLRELLLAYLRLLAALHNLDRLLSSVDELSLYQQLDHLDIEIRQATARVAAVKQSRRELLLRRHRRLEQSREGREILFTQLEMIEDIVNLLRDSTLAAPDSSLLNAQLGELMAQIEAADEAVFEVQSLQDEAHQLAVFEERITASS